MINVRNGDHVSIKTYLDPSAIGSETVKHGYVLRVVKHSGIDSMYDRIELEEYDSAFCTVDNSNPQGRTGRVFTALQHQVIAHSGVRWGSELS